METTGPISGWLVAPGEGPAAEGQALQEWSIDPLFFFLELEMLRVYHIQHRARAAYTTKRYIDKRFSTAHGSFIEVVQVTNSILMYTFSTHQLWGRWGFLSRVWGVASSSDKSFATNSVPNVFSEPSTYWPNVDPSLVDTLSIESTVTTSLISNVAGSKRHCTTRIKIIFGPFRKSFFPAATASRETRDSFTNL